MILKDLIFETRSYRRFDGSAKIPYKTLQDLVDLARLSASGANRQPLKYAIINTPEKCEKVFPSLAWAAYLKDWAGPSDKEKPSAYIIILGDKSISEFFGVDHGIAAQSIRLGATEAGLGSCIIAALKRDQIRKELDISEKYEILLVIALGKAAERIIIDEMKEGDVKYWRDSEKNHHVPKRSLDEIIIDL